MNTTDSCQHRSPTYSFAGEQRPEYLASQNSLPHIRLLSQKTINSGSHHCHYPIKRSVVYLVQSKLSSGASKTGQSGTDDFIALLEFQRPLYHAALQRLLPSLTTSTQATAASPKPITTLCECGIDSSPPPPVQYHD